MGQTILTKDQQMILKLLASEPSLSDFYLTGGTALSEYYLHHRDSDDLDFFSEQSAKLIRIDPFITRAAKELGATSVRHERVHDRQLFLLTLADKTELKLEFTRYPFPSLEEKNQINGIRVDSLRDITTNKLFALIERFEPKDFVDLYFLLQRTPLEQVRQDLEKKFGIKISPMVIGSEFAKVARIEALPKMHIPLTISDLKSFFVEQARLLKPNIFDQE